MSTLKVYICRHGQTEWSRDGLHTSFTDLDLIEEGVHQAQCLSKALEPIEFSKVFSSPLKRATTTADICGFAGKYEIEPALTEWNYGEYEGIATNEIRKTIPGWNVFDFEMKGGESLSDIQKRAHAFIEKLRGQKGNVLCFSSGHITRALGACWIGFSPQEAKHLALSTASISILGYERETPVIHTWNEVGHLNRSVERVL